MHVTEHFSLLIMEGAALSHKQWRQEYLVCVAGTSASGETYKCMWQDEQVLVAGTSPGVLAACDRCERMWQEV